MSSNTSAPLKTEHFDMDTFFDFNQSTTQASPSTTSTSTPRAANLNWNAVSPFDKHEEHQQFSGPSHDYNLYKQQVGIPVGSLANVQPQSTFNGYDSNMGDMEFGWASGIDIDADMSMDFNNPQSSMPPMFFPPPASNASESFVDPNSIGGHEEPTSNVGRLWPGMHSQQAQQMSMQKAAQTQAMQQRQMKLHAQHAQYRTVGNSQQSQQAQTTPQPSQGHAKRPSHASEPHVEESISRLLSQMRNGTSASADDDDDDNDMLPHIARMKKDEEDMDEDERLLASEEGKKLSSKERRQLRNKVSARAFRSRRKEYIGQLEGEVALKAQECTNLRTENTALLQENDRYRTLIETLLRHPAFTPFIDDISRNPSMLPQRPQQQQQQQQPQPTPAPAPQQHHIQQQPPMQQQQHMQQDSKPAFMNFDASQLQIPQQQQPQSERVGLTMIPENDFSKLDLNGFQRSMSINQYHGGVSAYAVINVPAGPDPVDLLVESPARLPIFDATSAAFGLSATTVLDSTTCSSSLTLLLARLDSTATAMSRPHSLA